MSSSGDDSGSDSGSDSGDDLSMMPALMGKPTAVEVPKGDASAASELSASSASRPRPAAGGAPAPPAPRGGGGPVADSSPLPPPLPQMQKCSDVTLSAPGFWSALDPRRLNSVSTADSSSADVPLPRDGETDSSTANWMRPPERRRLVRKMFARRCARAMAMFVVLAAIASVAFLVVEDGEGYLDQEDGWSAFHLRDAGGLFGHGDAEEPEEREEGDPRPLPQERGGEVSSEESDFELALKREERQREREERLRAQQEEGNQHPHHGNQHPHHGNQHPHHGNQHPHHERGGEDSDAAGPARQAEAEREERLRAREERLARQGGDDQRLLPHNQGGEGSEAQPAQAAESPPEAPQEDGDQRLLPQDPEQLARKAKALRERNKRLREREERLRLQARREAAQRRAMYQG